MWKLLNLWPGRRRRMEQELERELRYHVDRRVDDLVRSGMRDADARRQKPAPGRGAKVASIRDGRLQSVRCAPEGLIWIRRSRRTRMRTQSMPS